MPSTSARAQAASTRSVPIAPDEPENADAGAEALLGMRPRAQDHIGQDGGVVADRGGLAADAFMCPVAIAPMRTGHVLGDGRRPVRPGAAPMTGDALAAMENLDRGGGDPRLDLLADQLLRHAVVVLGDLDMIVEADAAALPLGVFVGFGRQGSSAGRSSCSNSARRLVPQPRIGRSLSSSSSARIAALRSASEKKRRCRSRARIQRPTTWTADLDLRFVARLVGPRRDDRGAVMPRHVGIGPVDHRLVERGLGDAGL